MILLVIIAGVLLWHVALAFFEWQVVGIAACIAAAAVLLAYEYSTAPEDPNEAE